MAEILRAQSIHKTYSLGQAKLHVLKGLDLTIEQGEFVAIVGSSGSGKSTLLHILGALDKADKGTVEFRGRDLRKFRSAEYARFRNKMVGFVFQFYHLLDELNVLENVLLPAMAGVGSFTWAVNKGPATARAKMLLEKMGLAGRLRHKAYQLSGGERQRVAIARALMNDPVLLLADEPTGNLDSATGNGILESLAKFNQEGQTIVMVTHDDRVAKRADRIIRLTDGKIAS